MQMGHAALSAVKIVIPSLKAIEGAWPSDYHSCTYPRISHPRSHKKDIQVLATYVQFSKELQETGVAMLYYAAVFLVMGLIGHVL